MSTHEKKDLPKDRRSEGLENMSAVWVIADRIEIAVRDVDIERDGAARFEAKFKEALKRRPRKLVVRLQAKELCTSSLGVILRARADAQREGVTFVLQPESRRVAQMVQSLGVDQILNLAA